MIHHRERFALRLESLDYDLSLEAGANQLECDAPLDGVLLLREVHLAHSAGTDLFEDAVGADLCRYLRHVRRRFFQNASERTELGALVAAQEGLNLPTKALVVSTFLIEEACAVFAMEVACLSEEFLHETVLGRVHSWSLLLG